MLKSQVSLLQKVQPLFSQQIVSRNFSTADNLLNKRKWISKWKNAFPSQVYTEVELMEDRCFDKILGYKEKSKLRRHRIFKQLLDRLVNEERVLLNPEKGKALARLAEHLIDTAKKGDVNGVYNLMHRKELTPKVFEELLPRYLGQEGKYTNLYRLHSESVQHTFKGRNVHKVNGNAVVEFKGNPLPPLLPPQEELERLTLEHLEKKLAVKKAIAKGFSL